MTHGRYGNVKIAINSRSNGRSGLNDNQLKILLTMACIPVFLPVFAGLNVLLLLLLCVIN